LFGDAATSPAPTALLYRLE